MLSGLDLERDTSRYYYLTMGGEVSTTTSSDKKLYAEVRRAMGVSKAILAYVGAGLWR